MTLSRSWTPAPWRTRLKSPSASGTKSAAGPNSLPRNCVEAIEELVQARRRNGILRSNRRRAYKTRSRNWKSRTWTW